MENHCLGQHILNIEKYSYLMAIIIVQSSVNNKELVCKVMSGTLKHGNNKVCNSQLFCKKVKQPNAKKWKQHGIVTMCYSARSWCKRRARSCLSPSSVGTTRYAFSELFCKVMETTRFKISKSCLSPSSMETTKYDTIELFCKFMETITCKRSA